MTALVDRWSDEQIAAELREARREIEVGRLRLMAAMANCGIPVPAKASADELLDLLDWRAAERLRRLAK